VNHFDGSVRPRFFRASLAVLGGLLVIVLGLGIKVSLRRSTLRRSSVTAAVVSEPTEPSAATEPSASVFRRPLAADRSSVSRPAPAEDLTDSVTSHTPTDAEREGQLRETLDRHLGRQHADNAWTSQIRAQVTSDVVAKIDGLELVDLNCGATLCRATLRHPRLGEERIEVHRTVAERFQQSRALSWELVYFSDEHQMTVYIGRTGETLLAP
jgi:hypothetical protein